MATVLVDARNVLRSQWPNVPEDELVRRILDWAERGGHEPVIVMHNDAVIQGLSEVPNMKDVHHWGVLTIGTGLGNARFTNRESS